MLEHGAQIRCQEKLSSFYWIRSNHTMLTKLYSHQFLVTVIAQAEGRHYTSRQLEKQFLLYM